MKRTFEIIGGIFAISVVLSMITFLVISVKITNGYYAYYEVKLEITESSHVYAVRIDGKTYWEKQIDEPIGILLIYNHIDVEKGVSVYRIEDDVLGTLKRIYRCKNIYQIGDRYYYRESLLERAF